MSFSLYTNKTVEEIFELLDTSEAGLSNDQAASRLEQFGSNEIAARKVRWLTVLVRQFKSPFFYLLFGAGVVSFLVGEIVDGFVILAFILVNVILGFLQEFHSEKAIALLKKFINAPGRVLRAGQNLTIDRKMLVPGDIVLLEAGDIAPADLRLIKNQGLLIDESILTGESSPVGKDIQVSEREVKEIFQAQNIIFGGTSVLAGKAEAVVIDTGQDTAMGAISKIVSGLSHKSAYEKELFFATKLMLKIVAGAVLFIFLAKLILHGTENITDFLIFCIALVVSILPEALPLVATFALSRGALKMAKEKVVARRLTSIEDLGNIEILCCDKTGTLTKNQLTLDEVYAADSQRCLLWGILCSNYGREEIDGAVNSFDRALFEKAAPEIKNQLKSHRILSEVPFDSGRLRASFLLEQENTKKRWLVVKGAPETVVSLCSVFPAGEDKSALEKSFKTLGLSGKRILALAYKDFDGSTIKDEDGNNLTFLGYFTFTDPLKETAVEAIKLAKKLGVRVKIITGDSAQVAGEVALKVGLINNVSQVVSGADLDNLNEEQFFSTCDNSEVFARVSPQTKFKIIQSLQKKYEVGFLGEGINDAPALKAANVGIVVQEASDVAREVSDIVLTQKDLRVIINGIKNGRTIFANINKYIKTALASNFGNFYSIAIISLFIPFLPMLPVQILLGNLLSDFPLITIVTDAVDPAELKRPKAYRLQAMIPLIICLALVSTIFDFIFFGIFYHRLAPGQLQTLWYIESILTEIALIFSMRTSRFFLKAKRPSRMLVIFTILDAILIVILPFFVFGQEAFHFVAPPIHYLFLVFFLVACYFAVSEVVKLLYFRRFRHRKMA